MSLERPHETTLRFLAELADMNFGGKVHGGAVRPGRKPDPDFRDGYLNNVLLDAIAKSAETKRWEPVSP